MRHEAHRRYTITGKGDAPPIIVVHGGPGMDSGSLRGDLGPLEAKHLLLYYDQRGGGRSSLPADTKLLTIDRHVDDLEALRRHSRDLRVAALDQEEIAAVTRS